LSTLFVNGTSSEQNNIATQLIGALNENDLSAILLSVRCLSEIIEETNLTTQIKMMSVLSRRLQELTYNLAWKQESTSDLIRYIAKIYRQIASKASECQLADETSIPRAEMEILMGSFAPWIEIVIGKLSENFQHTEEIFSHLPLLLEIMKFLSMSFDGFPYLCEMSHDGGVSPLTAVMNLSWKYLFNLIEIKHLNPDELRGYETTSEDGDRISVDIFVIVLFELLQICLSVARDDSPDSGSALIGSDDMMNLVRVLMRYVQLSSDQLEQAHCAGNEFIAAEDDETLELSVRHTGKIFLKNLVCQNSFKDLLESLCQILESDLIELQQLLAPAPHLLYSSTSLSIDLILKVEAMMFALSAIGRPVIKAFHRSMKGDMSVSTTPAAVARRQRHHHGDKRDTITDNEAMRLSRIIGTFVEIFYQFPSHSQEFSLQELRCFSSLSVVRGAISKVLAIYCPLLARYITLQSTISTCLHFSLLPSIDRPIALSEQFSEPLSSKLLHCRAYGEMMRIATKSSGPLVASHQISDQNILHIALKSCVELSPLCNESTIHIPLEIITLLLRLITQSVELELQSSLLPSLLPDSSITNSLGQIGLTVWSIYCFDPFALEMAKDMLGALVHVCSYSADSLTAFLDQFVPPIEHLIGELVGNQSSKTISDLSVKLLVEGISGTSPSSPYSLEASHRLSLPALQAMIRIMHFSTDVDGLVDVGETLRALIILLSSRHFSAQSLSAELSDELVRESLLCIRTIFTKLMDYNYSCAIGCLCQLIICFPRYLREDMGRPRGGSVEGSGRGTGYEEYIQQVIHIIVSLGHSSNHRNILIMGLVHIFNRNPLLIAESLGHMQLTGTDETALQYLLEVWFELHPMLESAYHLSVSSHGLMELIRMYSAQGISSGFLIRVLRLLLETLPGVIRHETQEV
jgi:hypothetical protein